MPITSTFFHNLIFANLDNEEGEPNLRSKRLLWFVAMIAVSLFNPLLHVSLSPFYIFLQHLLFSELCYWGGIAMIYFVRAKFPLKWGKASEDEIRVEDSVLLEGIGIFQGILFIYLSLSEELVSSSHSLLFLKWSIPLVTMWFYVFRGYGAIKNNPKWRYYSSLLLIYYMVFEASLLFNEFASKYIPVYVNSTNITILYLPQSVVLILFTFIYEISNALSRRYGWK
jgi:hypothetical protein